MCKYEWQCEASDHNKGGDEAAEVNGSRALARVGGEIITPAMREECVGKRSDYEGQCCLRKVPYQRMRKEWGVAEKDNEPTMRGNQFDQRAHERMIIKKPTARTKESRMTAGRRRPS